MNTVRIKHFKEVGSRTNFAVRFCTKTLSRHGITRNRPLVAVLLWESRPLCPDRQALETFCDFNRSRSLDASLRVSFVRVSVPPRRRPRHCSAETRGFDLTVFPGNGEKGWSPTRGFQRSRKPAPVFTAQMAQGCTSMHSATNLGVGLFEVWPIVQPVFTLTS